MPKIYQFTKNDKSGNIKNKTVASADLYFYGDIVSTVYDANDWWSSGNQQ